MFKKLIYSLLVFLLFLLSIILAWQALTPIYNFSEPKKFHGEFIYNPYSGYDSAMVYKANFHAHTGWDIDSAYTPLQFREAYINQGYDIISNANHQYIDFTGDIPSYEHGYNANNYHILMLNASKVSYFDFPLMLRPKHQMQYMLNKLRGNSSAIGINHPERIRLAPNHYDHLQYVQGYDFMEMNPPHDPTAWDTALSSGIYSRLIANDDAHSITRRWSWFQKCYTMVCSPSKDSTDIINALLNGNAYGVVISNEKNMQANPHEGIAKITDIGLTSDSSANRIYIKLNEIADSIQFISDNGVIAHQANATDSAAYTLAPTDSYARIVAYYTPGIELWSNAFVRQQSINTPPSTLVPEPKVNVLLTILNCLLFLGLSTLLIFIARRIVKNKIKRKRYRY